MSTQAVLVFINLDNSVRYVDLVNDGDIAGMILLEHYNNFNAANMLTSQGVISTLKPALQDCIFHSFNWGREKRETITDVQTVFAMADVIAGLGEDESPVYVFDAREYYDNFVQCNDWHYHKMYGHSSIVTDSKVYWKRLGGDGKLHDLI